MLHLIGRGNNTVRVFRNRRDFEYFRHTLQRFLPGAGLFIHHYVFMHTHYHVLAWVEDTRLLAPTIKAIHIAYHHYYRRRHGYKGHLWHSRFRSILIKEESQFLQCGRYIELNSVHAGICSDPGGHPWSSYHYYATGQKDRLIEPRCYPDRVQTSWTEVVGRAYQEFIQAGIDLDYQQLKKCYEVERFR